MKKTTFFLSVGWLLAVGMAFCLDIWGIKQYRKEIALQTARAVFQQIVDMRLWNARTKGIYGVVDNVYVIPNPYLDAPLRDLSTAEGIQLTMINPALMTRGISEISAESNGVKYHLTSLKPIRPENSPSAWERDWLQTFERGSAEQSGFVETAEGMSFRYMAPLYVEEACLRCHAHQGYRQGDVRGGISVTLPADDTNPHWLPALIYGFVACLGLLGIFMFNRSSRKYLQEIEEKEERYRQMFDESPAVKLLFDPESGAITDANLAACRFYGYGKDELCALKITDISILPPEKVSEHMAEVISGAPKYAVVPHKLCTGEIRDVEMYSGPITIRNKTLIFSIVHDISERVQAEQEIKRKNTFLLNIVESLPYPFYVIDASNYNLVLANSSVSPNLNWTGKTCYNLTHRRDTPCDGKEHNCTLVEVKRTKGPVTIEHIHYDNEGKKRHVEVSGCPIFDAQGEVVQLIEYSKDITEQVLAEEERRRLEAQLVQAYKMEAIGTLAGGIAHDFNNILGTILGYAAMAKEDAPSGSVFEKDLDRILGAANRAKDLVKQILTFSRQTTVEFFPLKIQPVIKEALKMIRASIPTTIEIVESIHPDCSTILADPTQIHQILMNLCTNASHAMEEKGGVLTVELNTVFFEAGKQQNPPGLGPGEYVELMVADTGSGIGPDIIDKIFEPYFTTKALGKGTGMGLSIVHGIARSYGGAVAVETQLGKGTTFHVYFPVTQENRSDPAVGHQEIPMGNERILFVDDEEILAEASQEMLERMGYRVTVRKSSLEALEKFRNQPDQFDLVITDQSMPGMTGADLATHLLRIRPDIPIILCTGFSTTISEEKAKSLGIKAFVLKPLLKEDLALLIRKVLDEG